MFCLLEAFDDDDSNYRGKDTNAVVTCAIQLFQNHFSPRRHPSEIIFQHVKTSSKSFQMSIADHEYFPTCSMLLKQFLNNFSS